MTLDSEVTTLLNRHNDERVADRMRAFSSVVRGRKSSGLLYGGDAATQPEKAAETPPEAVNFRAMSDRPLHGRRRGHCDRTEHWSGWPG